MADNTTLGFPALLQTEETNLLRFGNATILTHQLVTHAHGILSILRKWRLLLLLSPVIWVSIRYMHTGWSFSEAKIPKCGGNIQRTQFLRARLVTGVSKVGSTEIFMNNLFSAQVCKVETSVKKSSM